MIMPILSTKLYIPPPPRTRVVLRRCLIDRLNEGLHGKLTLISAPAGFGKTALVSEWVTDCNRPTAWLSLDEGDNDLTRFLTYFVAALQTIAPNMGEGVLLALQSPQLPPTEVILTALLNEIVTLPDDFLLVFYDLIYCAVGNRSVSDYQRALKPQGVCIIAGFTALRLMFQHMILGPRRSKVGGQRIGTAGTVEPNQKDMAFIIELLETGKIVSVIDRCYLLTETAEAIRYLETGRARGKVIIGVVQ